MKVTILTFSLTGNIKFIAKRITQKLSEYGTHSVKHISLIKLSKDLDSQSLNSSPVLAPARSTLESSSVVDLGCFTNTGSPNWRVNELLLDSVLLPSVFSAMKDGPGQNTIFDMQMRLFQWITAIRDSMSR
jgi:hypothetical protein